MRRLGKPTIFLRSLKGIIGNICILFVHSSHSHLCHHEEAHTKLSKLEVGSRLLAHEDVPLPREALLLPRPEPPDMLPSPSRVATLFVGSRR